MIPARLPLPSRCRFAGLQGRLYIEQQPDPLHISLPLPASHSAQVTFCTIAPWSPACSTGAIPGPHPMGDLGGFELLTPLDGPACCEAQRRRAWWIVPLGMENTDYWLWFNVRLDCFSAFNRPEELCITERSVMQITCSNVSFNQILHSFRLKHPRYMVLRRPLEELLLFTTISLKCAPFKWGFSELSLSKG